MRYTMRIVLLTAVVCAAGGMLTSKAEAVPISKAVLDSVTQHPPLVLVQYRCGRGYDRDPYTGRCYPNRGENYRRPYYREDYGGYGGYGGYGRYGGRCGRGYDMDYRTGRCYPNR